MEKMPFNSQTHRMDYEHTKAEISSVKRGITGERPSDELNDLIEERDALIADLEMQKAKAYEQAEQDNIDFDTAYEHQKEPARELEVEIERTKNRIAEITGVQTEERERKEEIKERERMAIQGVLSLEETITLIKDKGYLDTSFEGKELHHLEMRPLTKEEALFKFDHSGGRTWINPDIEDIPYVIPKVETLDVIIVYFGYVEGAEAIAEMDKLGVRPLAFEELIQYGIAYPEHQKQYALTVFGPAEKDLRLSFADTYYREATRTREKGDVRWLDTTYARQHGKYYFPVVRK